MKQKQSKKGQRLLNSGHTKASQQQTEEHVASINRLKILNQWRKLMRLIKVEDLRKEVEVISQNHEREVDRKDAIIQVLDRDLEDSEEQYQVRANTFRTDLRDFAPSEQGDDRQGSHAFAQRSRSMRLP